jgi:hypothetical protein
MCPAILRSPLRLTARTPRAPRSRRLVSKLLGILSRYELDGFLKAHQAETYTIEDFERISQRASIFGSGKKPLTLNDCYCRWRGNQCAYRRLALCSSKLRA